MPQSDLLAGDSVERGSPGVVCAEQDLLSWLCQPAAPAELPGTGKGTGICFPQAAAEGDLQGKSNEPKLEGKCDFHFS